MIDLRKKKLYARAWHRKNRKRINLRKKKLYQKNREYHLKRRREYYRKNSKHIRRMIRERRKLDPKKFRDYDNKLTRSIKTEVLSYYGKRSKAVCKWPGCCVDDLDVLTLDHIYNNGAAERKQFGQWRGMGSVFYRWLRRHRYPGGYQTLCANHQLKKEIIRRKKGRNAVA